MQGNLIVKIALFGYIPVLFFLFSILPSRRATIWGFLVAWLFLPMADIPLHPFTDYNKMTAACAGVLLCTLIFDSDRLFAFRPKFWDIPMAVWCICPLFSSVSNGLGAYDGVTAVVYQIFDWGLPYFIGRIYFNDLVGMRELAIGIVMGGLLYVPLCWFEIRFSPQLHAIIYGFHQSDFSQVRREGGFRPMVFMQHGLAVGMFMGAATLAAFGLWGSKSIDRIWNMPIGFVFFVLLVTAYFCHSTGATALMLLGLLVMMAIYFVPTPLWVLLLISLPIAYMYERATNQWDGDSMVKLVEKHYPSRAISLKIRILSETIFVKKAMEQPVFGWAGWNRFRSQDPVSGRDMGIPDAMWIIAFGHNGLVGLVSMTTTLLMPILLLCWRIPVKYWKHPGAASAAVLALIPVMHMCDSIFNAMLDPLFVMAAGGVTGLSLSLRKMSAAPLIPHRRPAAETPALTQAATA